MNKFFMFTQGRTGSTAIIDELNQHQDITCLQELFIPRVNAPAVMEAYNIYAEDFLNHIDNPYPLVPFEIFFLQYKKIMSFPLNVYRKSGQLKLKGQILSDYLNEIENYGRDKCVKTVGFKALSSQIRPHQGLLKKLRDDDYRVLYLERTNVVNKVLSGVVAHQRGVYNRKKFTVPDESYTIDIDDFQMRIRSTIAEVKSEKKMLQDIGFRVLGVCYEDFIKDREAFYSPVCDFLNIKYELPKQSEYSKMINRPIQEVVANYSELESMVIRLGLGDMLND